MKKSLAQRAILLGALFIGCLLPSPGYSDSSTALSSGQTAYVPIYSHVYVGERGHPFNLAVTLTVRNTDLIGKITVMSVDYRDSSGKLVKSYLEEPKILGPLASTDFFVKESDTSGGLAPCFIVRWESEKPVNEPIIEGVMIGARSGQGISFISRAKVIKDRSK
jgi:hypothetical protein